ncbi:hypothetical protein [Helicobacter typhlonius]|uniref:hypothetical protein n=1 Tax=Helicobacter typhlonius TaxID=76936 RepID=UPI002FE04AA0
MSYKHSKASCKHFKKETQNEYNNSGSSKYWGGQFAYLVDCDGQNLKLYLGISQQSSTHSTQAHDIDNAAFLRDTFAGIYAGSHCEACAQNPLQTLLAYAQAMLGIPSLKKPHKQSKKYCISLVGGNA